MKLLRSATKLVLICGTLLFLCGMVGLLLDHWPNPQAILTDIRNHNWYSWEVPAVVLLVISYVLVTAVTKKTPCYWIAILFAKLEAHQQTTGRMIALTVEQYRLQYPDIEEQVRRDISVKKPSTAPIMMQHRFEREN